MAHGERNKFRALMFEGEILWLQIYCIEESTCDIPGTLGLPRSEWATGELSPLAPLVTPLIVVLLRNNSIVSALRNVRLCLPWECNCEQSRGTSVSFRCRNNSTLTAD